MDSAAGWKECLGHWPDDLPRRGVIVTTFEEQIPFSNFLTGEGLLLLERATPDTMGARQVILGFDSISALKITDVVKTRALAGLGFSSKRTTS